MEPTVLKLTDVGIKFSLQRGSSASLWAGRQAFWALRNVSFDVCRGDVVGVVGRNGSGKTTCARLIAGIYGANEGSVECSSEVTLLTLGTGFSLSLTGRQNIYLNGAYLGFSKRRISQLEKTIIDFSEIEEFIDQPIRIYSSGMRSRLAFAIASHLEPKILVIDEVLSTGDSYFRQKAQKKITEIMEHAQAVVIVGHQNTVLRSICNRLIWLEKGSVKQDGTVQEVLAEYGKDSLGKAT